MPSIIFLNLFQRKLHRGGSLGPPPDMRSLKKPRLNRVNRQVPARKNLINFAVKLFMLGIPVYSCSKALKPVGHLKIFLVPR